QRACSPHVYQSRGSLMQMSHPYTREYTSPTPMPIRARDPERCAISSTYWAVTLLLAAIEVGQNIDRLARYTGCKRSFVARCARRLVDNGVWQGGETICEWAVEREAHPSFWKDVAVAEGKLFRQLDEHRRLEWVPAGTRAKPVGESALQEDLPQAVRYVPPRVRSEAEHEYRGREIATAATPEVSAPAPPPAFLHLPQRTTAAVDRKRDLFPDAVWLQ
ncbi:MAG TPA: hypothetical protein VGR27_14210, partial [Longimicrobiaceae bacterium]|nr:hypothetical protein [Longimicrobiaceae bacterium]